MSAKKKTTKKSAEPTTGPGRTDRPLLVEALRKIEKCLGQLSWLAEAADGTVVEGAELRRVRNRLAKAAYELEVGTPRLQKAGK